MIIDKVAPFWTDEDRARLQEIEREQDKLVELTKHTRIEENKAGADRLIEEYGELERQAVTLKREVENRYIKATSKKGILEDVQEIVSHIEKEDFLDFLRYRISVISTLKAEHAPERALEGLNVYTRENYENCYFFILTNLRVQLNALANDEARTAKAEDIVSKRVTLWYIEEVPAFQPMAHGKATDALAYMSTRDAEIDWITGNATIDRLGVQLVILKLNDLQATLGISTDKLLSTALTKFTRQNDFRFARTNEPKREVSIPFKDYAKRLGYDVEEHATDTPEEAEQEKKRAKNQLDNARKAIKKDLDIIHASTLSWEENIKGKARDFDRISLVTRTAIRNGYIIISFSPEIARYLVDRNLITQYPTSLLKISGRQPNAYYIGRKLAEHANIDNNIIKGTADRIGIPSLLAVTDLPSYEDVMKQDRHWERRIKEPLERALDTLTEEGVLKDWKYTHARAIDLTEEEAYNISSYEDFSNLYLNFTLADKVDHTERITAKREAREKAKTTRKRNASKNKKKGG